jgi:addiction module RelE/StbE family toxin
MKVVLRESALDDLDHIYTWISNNNPSAAGDMISRIRDRISFLEIGALAHMGRPGLVPGTRELIEHPYIVVYRVDDRRREVEVVAVFHGAQDRAT